MPKFPRLYWPQVAALAVVVSGAVTALVLVPAETWHAVPWEALIAAFVSAGGVAASSLLPGLFRKDKP